MLITIKAARINKRLLQSELAEAVGVSKKTIGAWENGKAIPTADKIEPLCNALGVSYDNIRWNWKK